MSKKKLVLIILATVLACLACLVYWLIDTGKLNVKKESEKVVEKATEITEEVAGTADETEAYTGDKIIVYITPGVSREDMDSYAEYFGGVVTDDSNADNLCYVITLKKAIPVENKQYFLKEMVNHIAIEEAYFVD